MAGELTAFGAVDVPGPQRVRKYIVDCRHAYTELDLQDRSPDEDIRILGIQLENHHRAAIQGYRDGNADEPCDCEPSASQLAQLNSQRPRG